MDSLINAEFNRRADEIIRLNRENHSKRMALLEDRLRPYDEQYFYDRLDEICKNAGTGCGLIYEYYVQKISGAIDAFLERLNPEVAKEVALLAKMQFDYCSPNELEDAQDWYRNNGCCTHGVEIGLCPAGCGE